MIKRYSLKADGKKKLSENFQVWEFASKDGADEILIDDRIIPIIQFLRDMWGPGKINSAYRTWAHNASVGSTSGSRHPRGRAADLRYIRNGRAVPPQEIAHWFQYLGFRGVGQYRTFAHGDTGDRYACWTKLTSAPLIVVPTLIVPKWIPEVTLEGEVTASSLNVREGPSTIYPRIDSLPKGTGVDIDVTYDGFGKLHDARGWVSLEYVKKKTKATTIKVGDDVLVNGRGWSTRLKTGSRTQADYRNTRMRVLAIHEGSAAPYQLSVEPARGWTTGFFDKLQVRK